jgi:hypothetical protein
MHILTSASTSTLKKSGVQYKYNKNGVTKIPKPGVQVHKKEVEVH